MSRRNRLIAGISGLAGGVSAGVAAGTAWLRRWRPTDEEIHRSNPGEELVQGGRRTATLAVTLQAAPDAVWPWLAQMGCDRAGWYSYDRLDNGGVPSADQIHQEWQQVAVGDIWHGVPGGGMGDWEVTIVEPGRGLTLRSTATLRGRLFDRSGQWPSGYTDLVWGFWLDEVPDGQSRLVSVLRFAGRPRWLTGALAELFFRPAHLIMSDRQLVNLRRRVEHG